MGDEWSEYGALINKNTDREKKQKYLKKTCPSATFSRHKSHTEWPGIAVLKTCRF